MMKYYDVTVTGAVRVCKIHAFVSNTFTLGLNFCCYENYSLLHLRQYVIQKQYPTLLHGDRMYSEKQYKQKIKCVSIHIPLIIMKMKMEMKNRS